MTYVPQVTPDGFLEFESTGGDDTHALQTAFVVADQMGCRGVKLKAGVYHISQAPDHHGLELRGEEEP